MTAFLIIYLAIYAFFFRKDFIWNPFKSFQYTKISFKSVYISYAMNRALFILNPFLSVVMRRLRTKMCAMSGPTLDKIGINK